MVPQKRLDTGYGQPSAAQTELLQPGMAHPAQQAPVTPQQRYAQQPQQPQQQQYYGQHQEATYGGAAAAALPAYQHGNTAEVATMMDILRKNPPPSVIRPSVTRLPANSTVKGKAHLPLGAVITHSSPDIHVPVVNMGGIKVIRCVKCRAYINCFVKFTENGNKWICTLCGHSNEVPHEYYCGLTATGERQDKESRDELMYGTVEFVASSDYMSRPPMAPHYLAVLDVSLSAIQSGLLECICESLHGIIERDELPGLDRAHFGIITYDSAVHFYDMSARSKMPHISVVAGPSNEMFVPMPDGGLVHVKDNKEAILNLLKMIPRCWQLQTAREANVSAAMTSAKLLLKHNGGKVILSLSTLPLYPELGLNPSHNQTRDSQGRPIAGQIADEADGLKPSSSYFAATAQHLAFMQVSIDLIAAPSVIQPMDLATISQLCSHSGGNVLYYPGFKSELYRQKLDVDLRANVTRVVGWEGVMRLRTSKGWQLKDYSGHYCFRGMDLMMLPNFTDYHTVTIGLDSVESVIADPICYLQLALLYTTSNGERRIRVITYALPCTQKLADISQSVDIHAAAALVCQKALDECLKGKLADARSYIQSQIASIVATLAITQPVVPPVANVAFPLDETNLIQQICLYCVGMLKSPMLREGRDISADQRTFYLHRLRYLPLASVIAFFNPLFMNITGYIQISGAADDRGAIVLPPKSRLSDRCLSGDAISMLCDGESLHVWVGRSVKSEFLTAFFGVGTFNEINPLCGDLMIGSANNPLGARFQNILKQLRAMYSYEYMRVVIYRQGDPAEYKFMALLSEDKRFFDIWQKFTATHGSTFSSAGTRPGQYVGRPMA